MVWIEGRKMVWIEDRNGTNRRKRNETNRIKRNDMNRRKVSDLNEEKYGRRRWKCKNKVREVVRIVKKINGLSPSETTHFSDN